MKESLPQQVHRKLRNRLLDGTLPPGARLDYKQLAIELEVSTTPVREAVTQLASEGFVDLIPRLGAVVRSLSSTAAADFYEVREAIECYACAKAAERISARHIVKLHEDLATMQKIFAKFTQSKRNKLPPTELRRFLDADLAFHQTILQGARNPALARTVEESHLQARIFFADRGIHDQLRVSLACQQHTEILTALEARNSDAAAAAMGNHIRTSMQFALDYLNGPDAP